MKILFVAAVESHILNFHRPFIENFVHRGYEVHVATKLDWRRGEFADLGVVVHDIGFSRTPYSFSSLVALQQLVKLMQENSYALVHVHTPMGAFLGRLAALLTGTNPVLYTAHGFHFFKGAPLQNWLVYYPMERLAARWTDAIITMNREDYDAARKFPVRKKGAVYQVNGVGLPLERYEPSAEVRAEKRKQLGYKDDDMLILVAAELIKRKNHVQMLLALKEIVRRKERVCLLLAGEGELTEWLKKQVREWGIEDSVSFLGFRHDLPELLQAADIFALTSLHEGLNRSVMEAMAACKPVVVTAVRGNRDLVEDGVNGYLVPVGDVGATAEALWKLVSDRGLAEGMGKKGQEMAELYALDKVIAEMDGIYGTFLSMINGGE